MERMVLSQFFPSNGIDGVIEEPIYGPEIDDLRDAVDAQYSEEIFFHRLVKSKGRANDWFLPGDVVCRRLSLDEERSDVLRKHLFCARPPFCICAMPGHNMSKIPDARAQLVIAKWS